MEAATKQNARGTAIKLAQIAAKATRRKVLAEDLVEIGKEKGAADLPTRSRRPEDYLTRPPRCIKHHPVGVRLSCAGSWIALGI